MLEKKPWGFVYFVIKQDGFGWTDERKHQMIILKLCYPQYDYEDYKDRFTNAGMYLNKENADQWVKQALKSTNLNAGNVIPYEIWSREHGILIPLYQNNNT